MGVFGSASESKDSAGGWKELLGPGITAILCFPMLLAH